jgi:hypothetical protein
MQRGARSILPALIFALLLLSLPVACPQNGADTPADDGGNDIRELKLRDWQPQSMLKNENSQSRRDKSSLPGAQARDFDIKNLGKNKVGRLPLQ